MLKQITWLSQYRDREIYIHVQIVHHFLIIIKYSKSGKSNDGCDLMNKIQKSKLFGSFDFLEPPFVSQ